MHTTDDKKLHVSTKCEYVIVKRYPFPPYTELPDGWYIQELTPYPAEYELLDFEDRYEQTGLEGWGRREWLNRLIENMVDENNQPVHFHVTGEVPWELERTVWSCVVPLEFKAEPRPKERVLYVHVESYYFARPTDPNIVHWLDAMELPAGAQFFLGKPS